MMHNAKTHMHELLFNINYFDSILYNYNYYMYFKLTDNIIDGESLMSLIEDLGEFQMIVPQSGLRMKLKKLLHAQLVSLI